MWYERGLDGLTYDDRPTHASRIRPIRSIRVQNKTAQIYVIIADLHSFGLILEMTLSNSLWTRKIDATMESREALHYPTPA